MKLKPVNFTTLVKLISEHKDTLAQPCCTKRSKIAELLEDFVHSGAIMMEVDYTQDYATLDSAATTLCRVILKHRFPLRLITSFEGDTEHLYIVCTKDYIKGVEYHEHD